MGMATGGGKGVRSEINVTPLVDVVLVLLIIFMVIVPLAQRGYDIEIPREASGTPNPEDSENQVVLSINQAECNITGPLTAAGLPPNCTVRVNKDQVKAIDLSKRMDEIFKNRKKSDKILFFAVQNSLNYEGVTAILDLARTGVGDDLRVAMVTDEKVAIDAGRSN